MIPVTTPDKEPMVATNGLLLAHVPPVSISARVVVEPGQTCFVPVIGGATHEFGVILT